MSRRERDGPEAEETAEAGEGPFPGGLGTDEPPDDDPPRSEAPPAAPQPSLELALDCQASQYFACLSASIQGLQQRAQQLLNRVNDSREEDQSVISSFKENLLLKVSGLAEQLEERLLRLHGLHNELILQRLQELGEVMERVARTEAELRQVCGSLEDFYRELCLQPGP